MKAEHTGLRIQFDPTAKLEVRLRGTSWVEVTPVIFRSWGGDRQVNGNPYTGPVYSLLTNHSAKEVETTQEKITQ